MVCRNFFYFVLILFIVLNLSIPFFLCFAIFYYYNQLVWNFYIPAHLATEEKFWQFLAFRIRRTPWKTILLQLWPTSNN